MWLFGGVWSRLVAAVACVVSFGCIDASPDPRILTGPLLVDSEFDEGQRASIRAAVEMWTEATDGRFAPEIRFGEVGCAQPFAIEAVHTEGCFIGHEVDDERSDGTDRVLGAADRASHWVSVVTWLEGTAFEHNVAHELGHYMLIGHGEGIMAQARDQQGTEVAATSLSEFCAIWDCERTGSVGPHAVRAR